MQLQPVWLEIKKNEEDVDLLLNDVMKKELFLESTNKQNKKKQEKR